MRQETMMVVFNEAPASAKQAGVLHLLVLANHDHPFILLSLPLSIGSLAGDND